MPVPKVSDLFTGGVSVPFEGTSQGGLKLLYGDEYVKKQIEILAADCDSSNPFQTLGIGLENVFQIKDDPRWQGKTRSAVARLFKVYFEPANLARLISVEFDANPTSDGTGVYKAQDGDMVMTIKFLSIESNTEQEVRMSSTNPSLSGSTITRGF